MKKDQNCQGTIPEDNLRIGRYSRATMSGTRIPTMHCSLSSAQAPPQWRLPRYWMPSVVNQGMAKNKQMLFKHMSKQPLMESQHGLKYWKPMVPMVLALYGHPDSGGIWEQHLNASLAKKGWRQILPEMWQSIFRHDGLDLILVVYVDEFKMAGPKNNLAKGWAGIRSVVDLGEPEHCDRYFGCMRVEKNGIKLPTGAHPFAHVFDPQRASACSAQVHRKNDYWERDPSHQTWTRHHLQPRKKLFYPGDEGGQFNGSLKPQRTTVFNAAVIINDGSPKATNTRLPEDRTDASEDNWTLKNPNMKTDIFWTGKTVFHYGDHEPSVATPSKNRPGSHRSKRDAKKEAKEQRFKPIESVVPKPAGCMTKPVNLMRYDMSSFLESCVEAYCKLAQVKPDTLKKSFTPFTELGIPKPTLSENEEPGRLQPIASKVLMKILFAARMARFDLLRATQSLASRVTKWSIECDVALHRLVAYIIYITQRTSIWRAS